MLDAFPSEESLLRRRLRVRRLSTLAVVVFSAAVSAFAAWHLKPEAEAPDPQLEIVSNPAGARVTINGIGRGETPITVRNLVAGEQRVRLTLEGYQSDERTVFLAEGLYSRSMHFALRKLTREPPIAEH